MSQQAQDSEILVDSSCQDEGIVIPNSNRLIVVNQADHEIEFDSDGEEMPIPGEESVHSSHDIVQNKPQYTFLKDDATK